MKKKYALSIVSTNAPIVELDSEARAAYIRFSDHPVAETKELTTRDCVATLDTDSRGEVVGIELIGVTECSIGQLLEKAGVSPLPPELERTAKYVLA